MSTTNLFARIHTTTKAYSLLFFLRQRRCLYSRLPVFWIWRKAEPLSQLSPLPSADMHDFSVCLIGLRKEFCFAWRWGRQRGQCSWCWSEPKLETVYNLPSVLWKIEAGPKSLPQTLSLSLFSDFLAGWGIGLDNWIQRYDSEFQKHLLYL